MERPKQTVKSFDISKRLVVRGVAEGPGQRRGAGRGRRQHRPVREVTREGQPLQALEPDGLGELFPRAGAGGGDTEGPRGRGQGFRCA